MEQKAAIAVENLTKEFSLRGSRSGSLKDAVLSRLRPSRYGARVFRALDDVNFSVLRGETLGIIGSNGAGKSTLLALITGTMAATRGRIRTDGTISSLLELGAGFHPDLSGRENVFLYGAIMGLSRKQMRERFDRIVSFAGLESFIDQPVKHYSSGMYVRLGFSVAVEVDPDILLIDEVLAVGDADFQRKCLDKISEFRQRGKTMLIISHDLKTIQSVSNRILLLDGGKILGLGDPAKIVESYETLAKYRNAAGLRREWGTGEVRLTKVEMMDESGAISSKFSWGRGLVVRITYNADHEIAAPVFGFAISDSSGRVVYGNNTQIEGFSVPSIRGTGSISLRIDKLLMGTGNYLLSCSVHSSDHKTNYHRLDNHFPFEIESDKPFEGCCYMPCRWELPK